MLLPKRILPSIPKAKSPLLQDSLAAYRSRRGPANHPAQEIQDDWLFASSDYIMITWFAIHAASNVKGGIGKLPAAGWQKSQRD